MRSEVPLPPKRCSRTKEKAIFCGSKKSEMSNKSVRIDEGRKKANISAKACRVCGEAIEYTRRAARDWDHIEYCSAVCRRTGTANMRLAAAS
jgi:hypothetical protein